jgi:FkbM family methyltransferase
MLFRHLKARGNWDRSTVDFLVNQIHGSASKEVQHTLLDLGSNIGMISLQALNQTKRLNCICVEPVIELIECAEHNLKKHVGRVKFFNFALDDCDGRAKFFQDDKNCGNGSLNKSLLPNTTSTTEVQTRNSREFFEDEINIELKYLLKSDIQGSEAKVLAQIPTQAWGAIDAAVIEIWATVDSDSDSIERCVKEFEKFTFISWDPKKQTKISTSNLLEFWKRGDGQIRNIYLSRH